MVAMPMGVITLLGRRLDLTVLSAAAVYIVTLFGRRLGALIPLGHFNIFGGKFWFSMFSFLYL
jgi:hypothetical protein